MTGKRWLVPVLAALTASAAAACVEQEGADDMEALQADTAQPEMTAEPVRDTASDDIAVWNTDADARLAAQEFDAWLEEQDFYGEWNTDGAEGLTAEELAAGLAGVLDADGDGDIGESEWQEARADWATEDAALSDWDTSGDGSLDESELASGLQDGDRWGEWDENGNGTLERSEFNAAVFGAWDTNDDDYVDAEEWGASHDRWS